MTENRHLQKLLAGLTPAMRLALKDAWKANWGQWYAPIETRTDVRARLINGGYLSRQPANHLNTAGRLVSDHLNGRPL